MRSHKNEKWQLVQSAAYANESELRKLLSEQPSRISVEEVRPGAGALVAAVREFPLEVGFIDLVGFTAGGASLWGMRCDELDQKSISAPVRTWPALSAKGLEIRIVRLINDAGRPAFSLAALEMRRFQKEQTEILVPHLFGAGVTIPSPSTGRSQWTEQRFFDGAGAALQPGIVTIHKE